MYIMNLFTTLFTNKRNEEVSRDFLLFSSHSCFSVYLQSFECILSLITPLLYSKLFEIVITRFA